ncbi:MAG: hypothetical protein HQL61_15275 [Magnetococcales bacterium]|nr:hypothetical protein [Nitrospirota bacterium]
MLSSHPVQIAFSPASGLAVIVTSVLRAYEAVPVLPSVLQVRVPGAAVTVPPPVPLIATVSVTGVGDGVGVGVSVGVGVGVAVGVGVGVAVAVGVGVGVTDGSPTGRKNNGKKKKAWD